MSSTNKKGLSDYQDEKIRKALSHFEDAEFFGKLSSSALITPIIKSFVSRTIHLSISQEGIMFVGQISQESQIRSHLANSVFEEYRFSPSLENNVSHLLLDTTILYECLTLSSTPSQVSHPGSSTARRESSNYGLNNNPPTRRETTKYPSLSALSDNRHNSYDYERLSDEAAVTWLIATKNLTNFVVIQKTSSITLCQISPLYSEETPIDFGDKFNSSGLSGRVIIKSEWLHDALNDLELVSNKVSMIVSREDKSLKLKAKSSSSILSIEYPETIGIFEIVSNVKNISNTYSISSLKNSYPALKLSSKTCLKYNDNNALSMQFILTSSNETAPLFAELIIFAIVD